MNISLLKRGLLGLALATVLAAPVLAQEPAPANPLALDAKAIKDAGIVLDKVALVFKEVREFFGPDGTLIATNTEDLTAQFQTSGHYQAVTPLPIPRSAPPGRYRIVSKFTLETHDARKPVLLARVDGSFHIASRP